MSTPPTASIPPTTGSIPPTTTGSIPPTTTGSIPPTTPSARHTTPAAAVDPDGAADAPSLAIVVPAHRATPEFAACLDALAVCDPPPDQLVVVIDGGDGATVAAAERVADEVVVLPDAGGPARARNRGVAATSTELVYFVDSDVVVPTDVVTRLRDAFRHRPELAALIGSYDADPPAPGIASQYKNLLNHHVHQTAEVAASTFWGACGAIRRAAFDAVGGFDERYTRPCIEDIELGYRLRDAGLRIEVHRDLQVRHLKRWTPVSLWRADVLDRAVPWSELIVDGEGFTDDLNISRVQRAKSAVAVLGAAAALLAPRSRAARHVTVGAVTTLGVADARLLRFFAGRRGPGFAVAAAGLHWLSYLYSAASFGAVLARRRLSRTAADDRARPATG